MFGGLYKIDRSSIERLKKQYEEEQRRKRNNPSYTCSITDTAIQSWYNAVVEDSSYRSSGSCNSSSDYSSSL